MVRHDESMDKVSQYELKKARGSYNKFSEMIKALWEKAGENNSPADIDNSQLETAISEIETQMDDLNALIENLELGNSGTITPSASVYPMRTNNCVVTFIDDNGFDAFLTKWVPLCEEKGIKIDCATIPNQVGVASCMSLAQLKTLHEAGHNITVNGYSHATLSQLSEGALRLDAQNCKKWLIANGFDNAENVYVEPNGVYTDEEYAWIHPIIAEYFEYSIGVRNKRNTRPLYNYNINRVDFAATGLDGCKAHLDAAILGSTWLVILVHSWKSEYDFDDIAEFIDYVQLKGVPILPSNKALERKGNIVYSGLTDVNGNFELLNILSRDGVVKQFESKVRTTDITLSGSVLTFTDDLDQTVTAEVVPAESIDPITWTTSDSDIATVAGGVVSPKANGTVTITVASGEITKEITVNVSGVEEVEFVLPPLWDSTARPYYEIEKNINTGYFTFNATSVQLGSRYQANSSISLTSIGTVVMDAKQWRSIDGGATWEAYGTPSTTLSYVNVWGVLADHEIYKANYSFMTYVPA